MPRLLIVVLTLVVFLSACTDEDSSENEENNESNNEQSQEETQADQSNNADTTDMINRSQAQEITETLLTDVHNAMKNYKQSNDFNELLNQESMEEVTGEMNAELEEFAVDNGLAQLKEHMTRTYFQPEQNSGLHPEQIDTRFQILDVNQSDGQSQLNVSYISLPDDTYTAAGTYEIELIQDDNWKIANVNYLNTNDQPLNLEQRDITDLGYQFIETFESNNQSYIAYQQDGMLMARNTKTGTLGLNADEENKDESEDQSTKNSAQEETDQNESTSTSNDQEDSNAETNQTTGIAQKYREKLNQTQQRVDNLELSENATNAELVEYESKRINQWDTLLNNIYGALESQLPPNEMEDLRQKQREWITYRDNNAKQVAAEYGNGSFGQVAYNGAIADTTKERCYELVDQYME